MAYGKKDGPAYSLVAGVEDVHVLKVLAGVAVVRVTALLDANLGADIHRAIRRARHIYGDWTGIACRGKDEVSLVQLPNAGYAEAGNGRAAQTIPRRHDQLWTGAADHIQVAGGR